MCLASARVDGSVVPSGYRPWLDGVRAVAVLMVVVQHAVGQMPVNTGFVGVGVFFALSGYLITSLLLDERSARGSVSLRRFYLRRAARLMPALVLVVVACNAVFLLQGDRAPLRGSIYALTYTANYALIWRSDALPEFGPTWSLAVEEHFYLIWPPLLLWFLRRRPLRTVLALTLGMCVATIFYRGLLALAGVRYELLALGSIERADALLYGCAAAMAVRLGWRPHRLVLWVGMASIVVLPVVYTRETYNVLVVGDAVLALTAAMLVVGLDTCAPPVVRRALSGRLLVRIGVLSYGIYLWHGPVLRMASNAGTTSWQWRSVAVALSFTAAAASYHWVEKPIRSWARRRTARPTPLAAELDTAGAPGVPGEAR